MLLKLTHDAIPALSIRLGSDDVTDPVLEAAGGQVSLADAASCIATAATVGITVYCTQTVILPLSDYSGNYPKPLRMK